jgi:hypothetical protein
MLEGLRQGLASHPQIAQIAQIARRPAANAGLAALSESAKSASFESLRTALSEVEGRNLRMVQWSRAALGLPASTAGRRRSTSL